MTQITVSLSEEQTEHLKNLATFLGVDPNELARAACVDLVSQPSEDFQKAANYVLDKNRQLYERLA